MKKDIKKSKKKFKNSVIKYITILNFLYNFKFFICIKGMKIELIKLFFISLISFILYKNYIFRKICNNCIHNYIYKNIDECNKCTDSFIFKDIKFVSIEGTLNEIINHNKSISRFGDGELNLIWGGNNGFEKYNKELMNRLLEVLHSNDNNLLVAIPLVCKDNLINLFKRSVYGFWLHWLKKKRFKFRNVLLKNKIYYSSMITRFYTPFKDRSNSHNYIKKFKLLWKGRNITIVEGLKSRIGIGNDLLKNAKSIKRILCPSRNAFRFYDKILNSVLKNINKKDLILIALGPTATVLAYDLSKNGYQAVDLGHLDIQYEMYLRNSSKILRIPYKYVNEATGGRYNIGNVKNKKYYKQIIDVIS